MDVSRVRFSGINIRVEGEDEPNAIVVSVVQSQDREIAEGFYRFRSPENIHNETLKKLLDTECVGDDEVMLNGRLVGRHPVAAILSKALTTWPIHSEPFLRKSLKGVLKYLKLNLPEADAEAVDAYRALKPTILRTLRVGEFREIGNAISHIIEPEFRLAKRSGQ